jgi:aryl-alcohol dehydrogenase-like predicted oxidoreductase
MKKRALGRTGLSFFPVGLGGMPMSVSGRPDEARSLETLAAALDAGVDFIDTADVYCLDENDIGHNERLIAKAVKSSGRKDVLIATKGGLARPGGAWTNDARPASLRAACERSLKALGTDSIGLYQLHSANDAKTTLEDSMGELKKLQSEGKVRHVGVSNFDAGQLRRALKVVRVESLQNRCNPFDSGDYAGGLLALCEKEGITYLPYSVVGGHRGQTRTADTPLLQELAKKYGVTPYRVVVAWHLAKSPAVLPIPGASKPGSIRDSAGAATLTLDPADIAKIDALS